MAFLQELKSASLRKTRIEHDASVPRLQKTLEITQQYDHIVLNMNIEHWSSLLGSFTPKSLFVPLTKEQGSILIKAYEQTEKDIEGVKAAAEAYVKAGKPVGYLNRHEAQLLESMGPDIQRAVDELSQNTPGGGCFMKLSSRSTKDASARSGVFRMFYAAAVSARGGMISENEKLRILCESEGAALRFKDAASIIRALVLSERVWQDMTLAFRQPQRWQQNIVLRKWEPVPIDLEFRTFIFANEMTAVSQYAYQLYSARLNDLAIRDEIIGVIVEVYRARLRDILATNGFSQCVLDLGVIPPEEGKRDWKVLVIEINPFEETTDGALFSWGEEREILEGKREGTELPAVRVTEKPRAGALVMIPRGWKDVMKEVEEELLAKTSATTGDTA